MRDLGLIRAYIRGLGFKGFRAFIRVLCEFGVDRACMLEGFELGVL